MARQLRPGQLRTGSFYDITASFAYTASVALSGSQNALGAGAFIAFGNVTASVIPSTYPDTASFIGTSSFLLTSASLRLFEVTETGIVILATQSMELPSGSAPVGGMYFTSSSFFVGLE
jgi:hypothetical protein